MSSLLLVLVAFLVAVSGIGGSSLTVSTLLDLLAKK